MFTTRHTGTRYEKLAADYLRRHGLTLLESNFHSRFGEIDLIMRDGQTLVFVEVRFREGSDFGSPMATVTPVKQRKIWLTAKLYLREKGLYDKVHCRFDVVGIVNGHGKPGIEWIKNAFSSPEAIH